MKNLDFKVIKDCQNLYHKTGAIKRDSLRPEIANSWARYELFKNKKINISKNNSSKYQEIIGIKNIIKNIIDENNYKIYAILDENNIYYLSNMETNKYYSTGAEISLKLKNDFTVYKQEHISNEFDQEFTHGFFIKKDDFNFVIGISGDIKKYNKVILKKIKTIIESYQKNNTREIKNDSISFINFEEKFKNVKNKNIPLFIIGPKGSGKESFIKYIFNEKYKNYNYKKINCAKNKDVFSALSLDGMNIIYLDKISYLSFEDQRKLAVLLDSKLVNSSKEKQLKIDENMVFFSSLYTLEKLVENQLIDERLLTRLTTNFIEFKPLKEYTNEELIQILDKVSLNTFDVKSIDVLLQYSWEENFYDIKKLESFLNQKYSLNQISVRNLPRFVLPGNVEIKTIKAVEKDLIINTLNEYNNNIKLSSSILGISRSTLYRKMQEYNIET